MNADKPSAEVAAGYLVSQVDNDPTQLARKHPTVMCPRRRFGRFDHDIVQLRIALQFCLEQRGADGEESSLSSGRIE